MNKYYYTYGGGANSGGWTEVVAQNMQEAHGVFKAHHPCLSGGVLNCADYYTESTFRDSGMLDGNFGRKCREVLFSDAAKQEGYLIRYRFLTKAKDERPVKDVAKIQMPWWCTAEGFDFHVIVCYLPCVYDLHDFWPDAYDIEWEEKDIEYTDRFPKPDWMPDLQKTEMLWMYEVFGISKGIVWAADRDDAEEKVRRHYESNSSYSKHDRVLIHIPKCDRKTGVYEWR